MNFNSNSFIKLLRNYYTYILFIVIFINILLLKFPLTNILDFESSTVNGIFIALFSIFIFHFELKKISRNKILNNVSIKLLLLLAVPLFTLLSSTVLKYKCSLMDGMIWYSIITLPAVIIGLGIYSIGKLISIKYSLIISIILFLILLILPFFEIIFYPQIYFYGSIISYFPGTFYDELIEITDKYLIYRFCLSILFLIPVIFILINKRNKFIGITILSAIFLFEILKPEMGFSSNLGQIEKQLNNRISTKNFNIIIDDSITETEVKFIATLHEIYFEEVKEYLKVNFDEKIISIIFKDDIQKSKLFGSRAADVAKPWLNQIYIDYSNYEVTLKHEIAHIVAKKFGVTPFKIASGFNFALIEGIASASDGIYKGVPIHYFARLAHNNLYNIKLENLYKGLNFFGNLSGLSYIYSGSFTKYLIDQYGIRSFKQLYKGNNFHEVYNKKFEIVQNEYYSFLEDKSITNIDKSNFYFGRRPLIKKVCPRSIARKLKYSWELFNSGNYSKALLNFEDILNISDNYQAVLGKSYSLIKLNRIASATNFLENNIHKYSETTYYYYLNLHLADLAILENDDNYAVQIYEELLNNDFNDDFNYRIYLRMVLYKLNKLKAFLEGDSNTKTSIIKESFSENDNYILIPYLIDENIKADLDIKLKRLMNKNIDYNFKSYILYKLSIHFAKKLNIKTAENFARYAIEQNENKNIFLFLLNNLKIIKSLRDYPQIIYEKGTQ